VFFQNDFFALILTSFDFSLFCFFWGAKKKIKNNKAPFYQE